LRLHCNKFVLQLVFLVLGFWTSTALAQFTGTNKVINNGSMRFGNGVQLSINAAGNVEQPFYFSTDFGSWRKLTYSESALINYPLDSKIGVGGNGTNNWNLNGVRINNPAMAGQVFDDSAFAIVGGLGSGVLRVRGQITVGTNMGGGTLTLSSTNNHLVYTKIGRVVHITGAIQMASESGTSGQFFQLTGMPFSGAAAFDGLAGRSLGYISHDGATVTDGDDLVGVINEGGAVINVYRQSESGQNLGGGQVDSNSILYFNFHYFTT